MAAPTKDLIRIRMGYIGACSLLARIAGRELDEQDRALIKQCLDDCAKATGMRVVRVSSNVGWALEPE